MPFCARGCPAVAAAGPGGLSSCVACREEGRHLQLGDHGLADVVLEALRPCAWRVALRVARRAAGRLHRPGASMWKLCWDGGRPVGLPLDCRGTCRWDCGVRSAPRLPRRAGRYPEGRPRAKAAAGQGQGQGQCQVSRGGQGAKGPRGQGAKGPRGQEAKGPRGQGAKGPGAKGQGQRARCWSDRVTGGADCSGRGGGAGPVGRLGVEQRAVHQPDLDFLVPEVLHNATPKHLSGDTCHTACGSRNGQLRVGGWD